MKISSVYIHVPFCKKICSYCDFCKVLYHDKWVKEYLNALEEEIKLKYQKEIIKTIYIGGGTPSCLDTIYLEKLLKIINVFNKDKDFEFTIEFNPEDITLEKIHLLKKYGVNRISIGIETFNQKHLKTLNRDISYEDIKNKIKLLKNNGFNNINVDLIYAIYNQTLLELKDDLEKIVSLDINHISTYSLMLEEGTILNNKKTPLINEDLDEKMYQMIIKYLKENNFNHYEVSNFAKDGYLSKHNLVYWNNEQYYGFGPGASGYIGNIRYTNTRNLNKYFKKEYIYEAENLSKKDIMDYEIILGLRKTKGINAKDFYYKYKVDIFVEYRIDDLVKDKYLMYDNNYLYINPDKLYIMNEILINVI